MNVNASTTLGEIRGFRDSITSLRAFIPPEGSHTIERRRIEKRVQGYLSMTVEDLLKILAGITWKDCKEGHHQLDTSAEDCLLRGHAGCGHPELPESANERVQVGTVALALIRRQFEEGGESEKGAQASIESLNALRNQGRKMDIAAIGGYGYLRGEAEDEIFQPAGLSHIWKPPSLPMIHTAIALESGRIGDSILEQRDHIVASFESLLGRKTQDA